MVILWINFLLFMRIRHEKDSLIKRVTVIHMYIVMLTRSFVVVMSRLTFLFPAAASGLKTGNKRVRSIRTVNSYLQRLFRPRTLSHNTAVSLCYEDKKMFLTTYVYLAIDTLLEETDISFCYIFQFWLEQSKSRRRAVYCSFMCKREIELLINYYAFMKLKLWNMHREIEHDDSNLINALLKTFHLKIALLNNHVTNT